MPSCQLIARAHSFEQLMIVRPCMIVVAAILMAGHTNVFSGEGNPQYTNPIGGLITMGDPFVFRDEGRYYLYGTTSSGEGFKAWSSTNLTDWTELGFVFRKDSETWGQNTFWAPEAFRYRDKYYLVYSSQPADTESFSARICLAVADTPEGPFKELHAPLFDNGWSCIDGHVYLDTDGAPYLFFTKVGVSEPPPKRFLLGINHGVRLKLDLSGIEGEPVLCTQADQPWELPPEGRSRCTEGPFVFFRNGIYYMTYSANHYAEPFYGIGYATAPDPLGPWTKSPHNPLVKVDLGRGISGPGHNCVITSPDGKEQFMVYHTHADPDQPGGRRVVNIDRLEVDEKGSLKLIGPTTTPQPLPSGM